VERARTLVPIDDSAISGDSLTMDIEAEGDIVPGSGGGASEDTQTGSGADLENGTSGRTGSGARPALGSDADLSSPLLSYRDSNRTASASINGKSRFPSISGDDMSLYETSSYYGGGGGGPQNSWSGRRGGVQAVEVTTPEEACELMCASRYTCFPTICLHMSYIGVCMCVSV
jgi:hypothetical protein